MFTIMSSSMFTIMIVEASWLKEELFEKLFKGGQVYLFLFILSVKVFKCQIKY